MLHARDGRSKKDLDTMSITEVTNPNLAGEFLERWTEPDGTILPIEQAIHAEIQSFFFPQRSTHGH
jgi:hypothetical protein